MNWETKVTEFLVRRLGKPVKILMSSAVSGGSINLAYRLETTAGLFFVKINDAFIYPEMFPKEAMGLKVLFDADEIPVPEVMGSGQNGNQAFLVLKFIESASKGVKFWEDFGQRLAALHKHSQSKFGFSHDNYIGSLYQSNKEHDSWDAFFVEERLKPQIKMAFNNGKIDREDLKAFELFEERINEIFPNEPPALLHGDLWSGNFMVNEKGDAVLVDPAVYYGHREMDLGMSKLFGGFHPQFYEAYNEAYPLQPGWQQRLDYCNLYPLLVHVNLFGRSYLGEIKSILGNFTRNN
ncbi:MAG: fructosamine kinase family protein [Bacteroidales bacterium]|nr:fructosamine kinase family protein [Bacteroidales bacterium]